MNDDKAINIALSLIQDESKQTIEDIGLSNSMWDGLEQIFISIPSLLISERNKDWNNFKRGLVILGSDVLETLAVLIKQEEGKGNVQQNK